MMSLNFGIVCASLLTLANSQAPITNITIEKGCNLMSCSDISWTPGCIEIPSTGSMEKTCSCPGAPCPTCCLYGCKTGAWSCLVGGNCVEGVCPSISSGECSTFKAVNMATLPTLLNSGHTLVSYTGLGLYTSGIPASTGCSTIPPGAHRGFAGVNNDAVLVFDSPISEFYLLQLHVQTGDDLTISPSATTIQQVCSPGGTAGNAYHRIVLDTPTTTVTIKDVSSDGGSGYSIMVAECMDQSQTSECEDNGCDKAYDGKGESGICVPTNKDGWNVIYKEIDFSAPMKTGLCKSQDGDAECCGCFKQKIDKCEDKKCIPKKKIHRECVKKGEVVELDLFKTGRKCNKREDCHCYQKCKPNKKCEKRGGKCLGSPPKWPYQKNLKPCDKKKKCICYIPIGISTG